MSTPKAKRDKPLRARIFWLLGIAFSVIPAAVCVLAYFPLRKIETPEKLISVGVLLLLILAFLPLMRVIAARLKSPSAPIVWLIIFITFYLLSEIAEQMIAISFFAFIGNLIGALFFKLSRRIGKKND